MLELLGKPLLDGPGVCLRLLDEIGQWLRLPLLLLTLEELLELRRCRGKPLLGLTSPLRFLT